MEHKKEHRTSEILEQLRRSCDQHKRISVGEFAEKLSDRSYGLIVFIFGLITGIVPGVSVIFSIPIIIVAIQMILGQNKLWMPEWLAGKTFRESILKGTLRRTIPALRMLEKFIRPRLLFLSTDFAQRFIAVILIGLAFVVFLPLPGFNLFPAMCMCILALGILEKDGLLILIGSIVSIAGIYTMSFFIVKATYKLIEIISNYLNF